MIDSASLHLQSPVGIAARMSASRAADRATSDISFVPKDDSSAAVAAMLSRALQRRLGLPATDTLYDAKGRTPLQTTVPKPQPQGAASAGTGTASSTAPAAKSATWSESDRIHEMDATVGQQTLERNRQLLASIYNLLPKQAADKAHPSGSGSEKPPARDGATSTDVAAVATASSTAGLDTQA